VLQRPSKRGLVGRLLALSVAMMQLACASALTFPPVWSVGSRLPMAEEEALVRAALADWHPDGGVGWPPSSVRIGERWASDPPDRAKNPRDDVRRLRQSNDFLQVDVGANPTGTRAAVTIRVGWFRRGRIEMDQGHARWEFEKTESGWELVARSSAWV
jgi:hypothetical protein